MFIIIFYGEYIVGFAFCCFPEVLYSERVDGFDIVYAPRPEHTGRDGHNTVGEVDYDAYYAVIDPWHRDKRASSGFIRLFLGHYLGHQSVNNREEVIDIDIEFRVVEGKHFLEVGNGYFGSIFRTKFNHSEKIGYIEGVAIYDEFKFASIFDAAFWLHSADDTGDLIAKYIWLI